LALLAEAGSSHRAVRNAPWPKVGIENDLFNAELMDEAGSWNEDSILNEIHINER